MEFMLTISSFAKNGFKYINLKTGYCSIKQGFIMTSNGMVDNEYIKSTHFTE